MRPMSTRATLPPTEALVARLATEGLDAHAWGNSPGDRYGVHEHGYDKVLVAAAGSIVFSLPSLGRSVELVAGDRLDLPADTPHGAVVGPAGVTCLEAHLRRGSLTGEPRHVAGWGLAGMDGHPETVHGRMA
jgi:quercetin dioxygenase-like cupin family protein